MKHRHVLSLAVLWAAAALADGALAQLNTLGRTDVTATHLNLNLIAPSDSLETDFRPVDIDLDGDMDVVVGRKFPFTGGGPAVNLLLLNDGTGVLDDVTTTLTPFALHLTRTREVQTADMNNDGWPDLVMANAGGDPTEIYLNLGADATGTWLGLAAPIDVLLTDGTHQHCSIGIIDFNGDGLMDLYRGDYFSDNEDSLLMQDPSSPLTFIDVTATLPPAGGVSFPQGSFTTEVETFDAAGNPLDLNGDGHWDLMACSTLVSPRRVKVAYGDGSGGWIAAQDLGNVDTYSLVVADFDSDGRVDLFRGNDSIDTWTANLATNPNGTIVQGTSFTIGGSSGFSDSGRGSDFDGDGDWDVVVHPTDIDGNNCGTSNRMRVYINSGTSFTAMGVWPTATYDSAVAHFDCDGIPDVLTSSCSGPAGYRYFLSGGPASCIPIFESFFAPAGAGHTFTIANIPTGGDPRTLYSFFDLNVASPAGSGPFIGLAAEVIGQAAFGPPFRVALAAGADVWSYPIPPLSIPGFQGVRTRTVMVPLGAPIELTPITEFLVSP